MSEFVNFPDETLALAEAFENLRDNLRQRLGNMASAFIISDREDSDGIAYAETNQGQQQPQPAEQQPHPGCGPVCSRCAQNGDVSKAGTPQWGRGRR